MNAGVTHRETLPARAAGVTVLDWLTTEWPRDDWPAQLQHVTLDGRPALRTDTLHPGQQLAWHRPPWEEPPAPLDFQVVYEDEHLLIVDKPSGLPTLPGGGYFEHTLLWQVRRRDPKWSPAHRLGRGTSGLVVFTDVAETHRLFRERRIEKRYVARITGTLAPQTLRAPIGPVPHPRLGTVHAVSAAGRHAETIVERVEGQLAYVRIVTGRPHQIRIHLAHAGCPLEGDPLYAANGTLLDALPGDCGYWLRAYELKFAHPITGAPLTLTAPDLAT